MIQFGVECEKPVQHPCEDGPLSLKKDLKVTGTWGHVEVMKVHEMAKAENGESYKVRGKGRTGGNTHI